MCAHRLCNFNIVGLSVKLILNSPIIVFLNIIIGSIKNYKKKIVNFAH